MLRFYDPLIGPDRRIYDVTSVFSAKSPLRAVLAKSQCDGAERPTKDQSHSGAVNINSTPKVQYAYTEMSGGANHSRLTSMTYAHGYVVNYNYSSGLNDTISRLSSLSDTSGTLEIRGPWLRARSQ